APGTGNIDTNRVAGNTTPRGGAHQSHLTGSLGIANKVRCVECHITPSVVNHAKLDNRTTATVTFSGHALDHSRTPSVSRVIGIITCNNTGCHAGKTGTGAAAPTWNSTSYMTGAAPTDTITLADCQKCHALPPTPGSGSHATVAAVTGFPIGSQCAANCHTNVNTSATTYGTIFNNKSLHMNGTVEGGDCISCHGQVQGGVRAAVVGQFASQSHHIQGSELPLTKADCYKCHWEADINGDVVTAYHSQTSGKGVSLVIWNGATRPTVATPGTTYISYTANGSRAQISKLNAVCLGCHNSANIPAANLFGTFASDQYSPEPRMVPALAKTSILSRYSSTTTVLWSNYAFTNSSGQIKQYGTNGKKQVTKALSAHGNAIKNQFPAWSATTGEDELMADVATATAKTDTRRNVFCYDCHNSHGSDASGITSSYSSATGRYKGGLLKSTVAGQGGYAVTYKPAARTINYKNYSTTLTTAALFNTGASICNDCHNNDTRKVNISKPWSIISTYSSTRAIVGYWSTPYFDNYTINTVKRTSYKRGSDTLGSIKDLRKPMGGHYGSSLQGAQGTSAGHSGQINGLCTPCHDPHGVSSSMTAVNRGKSVPLLKGTWVTSPYREDMATPVVKRGGGSAFTGVAAMGGMPGYNIDQNTLVNLPAVNGGGAAQTTSKSNQRQQMFTAFPGAAGNALALHVEKTPADFAGLCIGCHSQA